MPLPMMSWLAGVMRRDLAGFRRTLDAYPDDASPWQPVPGPVNVTGTLVLHVTGNLQHFIGTVLGHTGYVRDRDAEFAARDLTRSELHPHLDATSAVVTAVLPALSESDFAAPYPVTLRNTRVSTGDFLLHLASHLGYHLGQADYHRRVVTGNPTPAGLVLIEDLSSARRDSC